MASSIPSALTKAETIRLRQKYLGPACKLFFKDEPLKIVKASGQYVIDERGEKYLDCISNVQHLGHCHPAVVKAVEQQMSLTNCNNRFLHDSLVLCAQKLLATLPAELDTIFFVNSGSEANDLAMRISQDYTGGTDMIVVDHAYHGHLISTIAISPYKFSGKGGKGPPEHVQVAPCPDVYRGKHRLSDAELNNSYRQAQMGVKYAEDVAEITRLIQSRGRKLSAFIMEGLQSCGGQVIPPPEYLRNVIKHVHAANGLVIVDEVQTGFGRVGSHFWSFQTQGDDIVPDIVTMGKPMGNGFPVSAVVCKKSIANAFGSKGMEYFNTYGGNPVSCAAALAVLKVLEEEKLQRHADKVGKHLLDSLKDLQRQHPIIGDVRGVGLFVGIDLVTDRQSREPASEDADWIIYQLKRKNVLISREGPYGNILKLKPPMPFSCDNADELCYKLNEVLKDLERRKSSSKL